MIERIAAWFAARLVLDWEQHQRSDVYVLATHFVVLKDLTGPLLSDCFFRYLTAALARPRADLLATLLAATTLTAYAPLHSDFVRVRLGLLAVFVSFVKGHKDSSPRRYTEPDSKYAHWTY